MVPQSVIFFILVVDIRMPDRGEKQIEACLLCLHMSRGDNGRVRDLPVAARSHFTSRNQSRSSSTSFECLFDRTKSTQNGWRIEHR